MPVMLGEDQILWDVVEEHLDEAEFLVEQWRGARASGSYTLDELERGPETRLAAHVDGLVVNGSVVLERVAWPVIVDPGSEPLRVAAAALAVLDAGDFRLLGVLDEPKVAAQSESDEGLEPDPPDPEDAMPEETEALDREMFAQAAASPQVDPDDPEEAEESEGEAEAAPVEPESPPVDTPVAPATDGHREGLALALALSIHPQLGEQLRARVAKAEGPTLALLLQACADRGLHPGPALERGLVHDDALVRSAAVRAAAFGDRPKLLAVVESQLRHASPEVRAAALDTSLLWGSRAAWELALASYKAPEAAGARLWIACLGDDRHVEALIPLLADLELRPDVLWALGFSGRVPAVIACLALLDDDDELTRRLAGEAVAAILGLDLEDDTLWEDLPAEPQAGAEGDAPEGDDDDLEAELAPTPADELPLPNAAAIRERWAKLQTAFVPGRRYLFGKPVEREGPGWALSMSSCRRIDVLAREVAARSQGVGRWPARARAGRHIQATNALAELGRQAGAIQGDRR